MSANCMNTGIITPISEVLEPARRAMVGVSGRPVLSRKDSRVSAIALELSMASISGLPL